MSVQRQMLMDQNIDDVLVGRLVKKSNARIRIRDKTEDECKSRSKDVNKALRNARGFWLLESKKPKLN